MNVMGENTTNSGKVYRSFDDFRQTFYPKSSNLEKVRESGESFGRDLARYAIEKHFPPSHSDKPKQGA